MIDKRLREILEKVIDEHSSTVVPPPHIIEYVDRTISQIKALVIESLGEEKKCAVICSLASSYYCCQTKQQGYNQKIAEMKSKWSK